MASYKIKWKLSAKKEFKKIDKTEIKKIFLSIEKLSNDPFPSNYKKLLGTESINWIAIVKLTKWIKMNIIVIINIQRTKLWKL